MAFDGIVTKAIASELQSLSGARIDKIFQPNKNDVVLGFYLNGVNYALNICINPQNYRIHLTTHLKSNPQVAPNFCMVLRKHLLGLHIKNVITSNLERVITIEFEGFDDIDDIISKKLIVELMGKHCNIVLTDEENKIIDSLRHINSEDDNTRTVVPHAKYTYPSAIKKNFLEVRSFNEFNQELGFIENTNLLPNEISNKFNGISNMFIKSIIKKLNISEMNDLNLKQIYDYLIKIINNTDSLNLDFETIIDKKEDYFLIPNENNNEPFKLNFFIDDFYYKKETSENFKTYRDSVLKLILSTLKKYNKRLVNIDEKLKECDNMDIYRIYGELLTANLYRIKDENIDKIQIENYYDNNNLITIPLDKKYTPNINAKRYFKKYNKLKNTLKIVTIQKEETLKELEYIESIVYELENCTTIDEVSEIYEEISENVVFKDKTDKYKKKQNKKIKKSKLTKNKNVSFNPIKYNIDGFTLLVGRNNKENDYLTLKYSKKTDLWFHTKDFHGSHAILIIDKNIPNDDILIKCAEIAAYHSKARNSSNVPVDFCEVKYVKKPNGSKPGMVIYTNNKTLNVNPSIDLK